MPSFWVGLVAFSVLTLAWVVGTVATRIHRRRSGLAEQLAPSDRAAVNDARAGAREGAAVAMAARGSQARQGR